MQSWVYLLAPPAPDSESTPNSIILCICRSKWSKEVHPGLYLFRHLAPTHISFSILCVFSNVYSFFLWPTWLCLKTWEAIVVSWHQSQHETRCLSVHSGSIQMNQRTGNPKKCGTHAPKAGLFASRWSWERIGCGRWNISRALDCARRRRSLSRMVSKSQCSRETLFAFLGWYGAIAARSAYKET